MGKVAFNLHGKAARNVEIIVHIDETLGESRRINLIDALEGIEGIKSVEFCPLRYHLMLVNYDRETLDSQDVLVGVVSQNIHAELMGPL